VSYICGAGKRPHEGLITYTLFSAARIIVYIVLGLCIFYIGRVGLDALAARYYNYIYILAGFFLMLIGAHFILGRRMELKPFNIIYRHIVKGDTRNTVLLGIAYGLLPCAPFLAVLSYIGLVSNNVMQNIIYAVVFGAGTFVSPLLLVSVAAGALGGIVGKGQGAIALTVRILSGIIAILLAGQLIWRAFV